MAAGFCCPAAPGPRTRLMPVPPLLVPLLLVPLVPVSPMPVSLMPVSLRPVSRTQVLLMPVLPPAPEKPLLGEMATVSAPAALAPSPTSVPPAFSSALAPPADELLPPLLRPRQHLSPNLQVPHPILLAPTPPPRPLQPHPRDSDSARIPASSTPAFGARKPPWGSLPLARTTGAPEPRAAVRGSAVRRDNSATRPGWLPRPLLAWFAARTPWGGFPPLAGPHSLPSPRPQDTTESVRLHHETTGPLHPLVFPDPRGWTLCHSLSPGLLQLHQVLYLLSLPCWSD